jgi:hypothetical protein
MDFVQYVAQGFQWVFVVRYSLFVIRYSLFYFLFLLISVLFFYSPLGLCLHRPKPLASAETQCIASLRFDFLFPIFNFLFYFNSCQLPTALLPTIKIQSSLILILPPFEILVPGASDCSVTLPFPEWFTRSPLFSNK